MTEAEWLACEDPDEMLALLDDGASDRKLRLFAHACCQRIRMFFGCSSFHRVVDLLERVADDATLAGDLEITAGAVRNDLELPEVRGTESGCSAAYTAASSTESYLNERQLWIAGRTADCARSTCYWAAQESRDTNGRIIVSGTAAQGELAQRREAAYQSELLLDIFGNPFRPVAFDPAWRTSDVLLLAQGIYDERAFDRMPILADALQDAGCDNDDILNHCRDAAQVHVRGCWVCDLVLGKS